MKNISIQELTEKRDFLIKEFKNLPGFITMGLGKKDNEPALVVVVNERFLERVPTLPSRFDGIHLIVKQYGEATSNA